MGTLIKTQMRYYKSACVSINVKSFSKVHLRPSTSHQRCLVRMRQRIWSPMLYRNCLVKIYHSQVKKFWQKHCEFATIRQWRCHHFKDHQRQHLGWILQEATICHSLLSTQCIQQQRSTRYKGLGQRECSQGWQPTICRSKCMAPASTKHLILRLNSTCKVKAHLVLWFQITVNNARV